MRLEARPLRVGRPVTRVVGVDRLNVRGLPQVMTCPKGAWVNAGLDLSFRRGRGAGGGRGVLSSANSPGGVRAHPGNLAIVEEDRLGLTAEQWEVFTSHTRGFPNQDENGVDLSLLRENLKLTPLERLRRLERAVAELNAIRGEADTPV